jgi:hypothetical protein
VQPSILQLKIELSLKSKLKWQMVDVKEHVSEKSFFLLCLSRYESDKESLFGK